jgi:two-component system response regulator PilR (NtrC family)
MSDNARILLVEDEPVVQDVLKRLLRPKGFKVTAVGRGDEAIGDLMSGNAYDLVVTDLMLPGADGMEVLAKSKELQPDVPVVMITAYATVDSAVNAMKAGATDYLPKPFNNDQVVLVVQKALEKRQLLAENRQLKRELHEKYGFANIVGRSKLMKDVFDLIEQAAPSMATILVLGESGTGKELLARAIHHNSPRKDRPFIALNAGSIPSDLLESQLFGHVKGAFTGALADKKGLFELADQGSIFLDEIGNIGLELQAKLLRVLQEREFMPVGSTDIQKVDVRVICATNADLEKMVADGQFREDLYYRLNVIEVRVPPLRERVGDVPLLLDFFIKKYEEINQKKIENIEPEFTEFLETYRWPGNVRELENTIERAVVLSRDGSITKRLLPPSMLKRSETSSIPTPSMDGGLNFNEQIQAFERQMLTRAIEEAGGVQKKAAEILGLKTTTFSQMLKRHNMR